MTHRFAFIAFLLIALFSATLTARYFSEQPAYADAFYHYNVAARLAQGDGFVDEYLWTYIGGAAALPAPSNLYWMPGTAIIAAVGMWFLGVSYASAQVGMIACLWGAAVLTYWLGKTYGGTLRHAWAGGLMLLSGGFFLRVWGTTDTFAPYALLGAVALIAIGKAATNNTRRWWAVAGLSCAGAHLIRADGLLLLFVGWAVLLISLSVRARHASPLPLRRIGQFLLVFTLAYIGGMAGWFARNLAVVGTILPTGGTQALWYTEYNDLFNYPPLAPPEVFFAEGMQLLLETRWWAFRENLATVIAVQGMIVLVPFIMIALVKRRREPLWWSVSLFALAIFTAFTALFPFPGVRGGLFHASAALMPFWVVLAVMGMDDVFDGLARYRRHWRAATGKPLFTLGMVLIVLWVTVTVAANRQIRAYTLPHYEALQALLPPTARVMINDPAQLYYQTGLGGVVLPNADPAVLPIIAAQYEVDYLLIELFGTNIAAPAKFKFDLDNPPPFLIEVPPSEYNIPTTRLYRIVRALPPNP